MPTRYSRISTWGIRTNGQPMMNQLMFDDEMAYGTTVANKRRDHALSIGAREMYGFAGDDAEARRLHVLGTIAELAVRKAVRLSGVELNWRELPRGLGEPDLYCPGPAIKIDVKGVSLDRFTLIVPPDQLKDTWLYISVSGENSPMYWIQGWCWGYQIDPEMWHAMSRAGGGALIMKKLNRSWAELMKRLRGT